MTIEDKIREMLESRGLFGSQASQVIEKAKGDKVLEPMKVRWGDHVESYPPSFLPVLWLCVKANALEWIEDNLPRAWFRPMFEGGPQ